MTLDRLIEQEGGRQNLEAVRRAINYSKAAMQKGWPFVEYNSWKQATEILVFEKVRRNLKSESYSIERTPSYPYPALGSLPIRRA